MRELVFLGDSKKRLREFPGETRDEMGYALYLAQAGETHLQAKPLKGYSGVFEIVSDHASGTYLAVYALKVGARLYVLHAFQKKSKRGIATPQHDLELIAARYKEARRREEFNV